MASEDSKEVIRNGWTNPGSSHAEEGICGKLARCAEDLKEWDSLAFGHVLTMLKKVRKRLKQLGSGGMRGDLVRQRRLLEEEERELMEKEEVMWFQRANANEFSRGDRNTKYFHKKASGRQKRNKLVKLIDDDGSEAKNREGMTKIAMKYFRNLFESDARTPPDVASQEIEPLVTEDDNLELSRPFTIDEVKHAHFSMHSTKAPVPMVCQHFSSISPGILSDRTSVSVSSIY